MYEREEGYASRQFKTAARTLLWYVLPPALLGVMIVAFCGVIMNLTGASFHWGAIREVAVAGGLLGFFVWMLRQFVRIIQLARHYAR